MNHMDIQARTRELDVQYQTELMREPQDEARIDKLRDEHDTLLVNTWRDENGLLTGGIAYIKETFKFFGSTELYPLMGEAYASYPGETRQISLQRLPRKAADGSRKRDSIYLVAYQDFETGHYIDITQYEATERVFEKSPPVRVYRPFTLPDGSIKYYLVREVIVQKYAVDAAPAFLNYLLVKADGALYDLLNPREDFDENLWAEMFMEHALGERRLPNFNTAPTEPKHAQWLQTVLATVAQFDEQSPLEEIVAAMEPLGKQFVELTPDVVYHYDLEQLREEMQDHGDDTDHALDDLDSTVYTPEVSTF